MFDDIFKSTCRMVCLGAGFVAGMIAVYAVSGKVGIIVALMLGIAMGVFMALVLLQIFCSGENADLGQMEQTPEGGDATAAPAGGNTSGPSGERAPVGGQSEPVASDKAEQPSPRADTGTSAAAAGTDKVAMRAETHSGGNDAATAQDPAFTSATTDAEAGATVNAAPKDAPKAKDPAAKAATKNKATAKAKAADTGEAETGTKPATLDGPRGGEADNLKEIKGVGPKLEGVLHDMGFYHFDQIANWTEQEVAWVDANLTGFKGRVSRDNWIDQAKTMASGGETEFSKRVDKGDVY